MVVYPGLFGTFSALNFSLFHLFFDKGYVFAKILSLTLVTYIVFCLSVIRLLPFTSFSILIILFLVFLADLYYLFVLKKWPSFKNLFSQFQIYPPGRNPVFNCSVSWSFVHGHTPDIEGLEKYMDWGFVNSALRTRFFLPLTCGMPDLLLIITILAILFLLSSPKFPASLRLLPTTFPSPLFAPSLLSLTFLYPEIWSSTF